MIDFFIEINTTKGNSFYSKPLQGIDFYNEFIIKEEEIKNNSLYFYSNCFENCEIKNHFYENNQYYFFLFGKVFYRNNVKESNEVLKIEKVFNIILSTNNYNNIIKGNYAFVLIKKENMSIEIVNSPFGVIPINFALDKKKIFISSSLSMILSKISRKSINNSALIQVSLFDTILGHNTLVNEINQVQYGEIITIKDFNVKYHSYYNHLELFNKKPKSRKSTIDHLTNTYRKNVSILPTEKPFLLGLTGGYDCRLNFAILPKEVHKNIIAYTYGMAKSKEIEIAEQIATKYILCYKKIILNEEFEKDYIQNADKVLLLGDGFTPFMRVNYFYAHKYLSKFSRECVTGMYGSEFIKPMHVMNDSVSINPQTVNAFFSDNVIDSIVKYFNDTKNSNITFLKKEIFSNQALEETIETIRDNYLNKEYFSKEAKIFNFYLHEGMRKFFMELIRIDKMFIKHNLPYLDIDFLELLLNSKYAGVHNNIFNESIIKRRKGQMFYADAISKLNKELNNIKVDRGYKPKYLRTDLGWIFVSLGYLFGKRLRKIVKGNTTYNTKKWRTMVYNSNKDLLEKKDDIFNNELYSWIQSNHHLKNEHVFGKHFSIKKWIHLTKNI